MFGTKLCCSSTGKVNEGLNAKTVISPQIQIKALTFVDDIGAFGSREVVQKVMEKCKEMEVQKLMEFSTDKSKWMCIRYGKDEIQEIEVDIHQGRIERTSEYKYLGNWINEKGNMCEVDILTLELNISSYCFIIIY